MTIETRVTTIIPIDHLMGEVKKRHDTGYRLVQIGCGQFDNLFEINYSFERDMTFENLRIIIDEKTQIPSITDLYKAAFVYENEIHDLFGILIHGIAIDYQGTFIRTAQKYPFQNPHNEVNTTQTHNAEGD